ncbi:MAG: hypothetical protein ACK5PS_18385 [Desulfopila sp.]
MAERVAAGISPDWLMGPERGLTAMVDDVLLVTPLDSRDREAGTVRRIIWHRSQGSARCAEIIARSMPSAAAKGRDMRPR